MSKIKLFKIDDLKDGTQRFQSQLYITTNTADFIMGVDGIMKYSGYGNNGLNFYPFKEPYEIVSKKSDMAIQPL